jgi:branched-chain amino acid transport system substrate-binding protein
MITRRIRQMASLAVALHLLLTVGCSKNDEPPVPQAGTGTTLKMGAVFPLTGGLAFVGESCRQGVELAVADHKQRHPQSDITVAFEDSANDPKTGLAAYRKLHGTDKTAVNFCIMSSVSGALLAQDPDQALLVSVVSHSKITENRPRTFRYFLSSDKETGTMASYLAGKGLKKVAFLYVNDEFGLDALACFRESFATQGGSVTMAEAFDKKGADVGGIVAKAVAANPDAIYFVGYGTPIAMIAKKTRELGYKGVRCSFSSFFVPPVLKQAGEAAEGVLFTSTGYDPTAPQSKADSEFIQKYETQYGKKPDYYAPFCYDLAVIFLESWEKANHDLDQALKLMKQVKDYPGVIGRASCNSSRDFQFPTMVKVVKGGKASMP